MATQDRSTTFLFGENTPYIEDLYEAYLADNDSVPIEWQRYFAGLQSLPAADGSGRDDVGHRVVVEKFAALAKRGQPGNAGTPDLARKQVALQSLVAAFRQVGARQAQLDPLRWSPVPQLPELKPAFYGLGDADMKLQFSTADTYFFGTGSASLKAVVEALEQTYCGTLAAEFMYLADPVQRQWWEMRLEATRAQPDLTTEQRHRVLERLRAAEGLENSCTIAMSAKNVSPWRVESL